MNNRDKMGLSSFGRLMWVLSAILNDMTNFILFRKVKIFPVYLEDGKVPAITINVHRLIGKSEGIAMDVNSFLQLAKEMIEDETSDFTKSGFTIKQKPGYTDRDFVIPAWAFPSAEVDIVYMSGMLIETYKRYEMAKEKIAKMMEKAGVPKEEVDKFRGKDKKAQ